MNNNDTEQLRATAQDIFKTDSDGKINVDLNGVADLLPVIAWMANSEGFPYYFNERWYDFTGLSYEASLGTGWGNAVHPDDLGRCHSQWQATVETGAPLDLECRFKRASDDTYRWHIVRAIPIRSDQGAITRWIGTSTDVQDQKSAERALGRDAKQQAEIDEIRQSLVSTEDRLEFAVLGAGLGTWNWDLLNDVLAWSPRTHELFGVLSDITLTRELFYNTVHPDDRTPLRRKINDAITNGTAYDAEYRVVHSDGSVHWILSRGRGYYSADGTILRLEGVVQDIDDKKRAIDREWIFLRDVLSSVTDAKLRICRTESELPPLFEQAGDPIELTMENGLGTLRKRIRQVCNLRAHSLDRQHDAVTAVSEAGMNAIVHGGGGVAIIASSRSGTIQARIEDHGSGINVIDLPRAALSRGFSTKSSLGHGLKMMLDTIDRTFLLTGPTGTLVILEQDCEAPLPPWLSV